VLQVILFDIELASMMHMRNLSSSFCALWTRVLCINASVQSMRERERKRERERERARERERDCMPVCVCVNIRVRMSVYALMHIC